MRRSLTVIFALISVLAVQPALGAKPPSAQSSVTAAASPNPVLIGSSSTIAGQLTGKKAGGATVELQGQPFPYSTPFAKVASTTASPTGQYSFRIAPTLNTAYRVIAHTAPAATSPNLLVKVRVRVTLGVSATRPSAGQLVRFSGFVLPAYTGKFAQIQRKTSSGWRTVAQAKLLAAKPLGGIPRSTYSKRLRIRGSGTYRVRFNPADGARLANVSRTRRLTVT